MNPVLGPQHRGPTNKNVGLLVPVVNRPRVGFVLHRPPNWEALFGALLDGSPSRSRGCGVGIVTCAEQS